MSKLSQAVSKYEDLATPPASQASVSITKITLAGLPVLMLAYFAFLYAANAWLPVTDAERVKEMLDVVFPILMTVLGGGGIGSLYGRSLMLTNGKIKSQTPQSANVQNAGEVNIAAGESTPAVTPFDSAEYSEPEPDYQPATYEEAVEAVR